MSSTEVWIRWTFEDLESARAAEKVLRDELAQVPGAGEVSVDTEPPNLGAIELFTFVVVVISLPHTINEALKATGELMTRLRGIAPRLRGLRSAAVEDGEGGLIEIPSDNGED